MIAMIMTIVTLGVGVLMYKDWKEMTDGLF